MNPSFFYAKKWGNTIGDRWKKNEDSRIQKGVNLSNVS